MIATQRRYIGFANTSIAIEYAGARAAMIVDFLFSRVPVPQVASPFTTYRLSATESADLTVDRNEVEVYRSRSEGEVADFLSSAVGHDLADQARGGVLFHAAALMWQGRGVLLAGSVGAGKSTLTAWLISQGLSYLTDELVFVPQSSDCIEGFTRPLNLKKSARVPLQSAFDFGQRADRLLSNPNSDLLATAVLNIDPTLLAPPLGLILFPHYQAESAGVIQPVSKANAGWLLMQTLVNARNLSDHGLAEVARLARSVPAYELHYAHFDQIEARLPELLQGLNFDALSK